MFIVLVLLLASPVRAFACADGERNDYYIKTTGDPCNFDSVEKCNNGAMALRLQHTTAIATDIIEGCLHFKGQRLSFGTALTQNSANTIRYPCDQVFPSGIQMECVCQRDDSCIQCDKGFYCANETVFACPVGMFGNESGQTFPNPPVMSSSFARGGAERRKI